MNEKSSRLEKGWQLITEVHGDTGHQILQKLAETSPDLVHAIVGFGYGEVYDSPLLSKRYKQMAVVAALCALNNAQSQLEVHIKAAFNVGCTLSDIEETIIQTGVYAGVPAAMNGIMAMKKAVADKTALGIQIDPGKRPEKTEGDRLQNGIQTIDSLVSGQSEKFEKTAGQISPDLVRLTLEYAFGEIYTRNNLSPKERELIIIAALTAGGKTPHQLKWHLRAGLNTGWKKEELQELIQLMILYAGFPAAMNATALLAEL